MAPCVCSKISIADALVLGVSKTSLGLNSGSFNLIKNILGSGKGQISLSQKRENCVFYIDSVL